MQRRAVITGLGTVNAAAADVPAFQVSLAAYSQQLEALVAGDVPSSEWQRQAKSRSSAYLLPWDKAGDGLEHEPAYRVGWACAQGKESSLPQRARSSFGNWGKWSKRLDRSVLFGAIASTEALRDAGLSGGADGAQGTQAVFDPFRAAVLLGNAGLHFALHERNQKLWRNRGISQMEPLYIVNGISNSAAGAVARIHQFRGPTFSLAAAGATSLQGLQLARLLIAQDSADICLVGGCEAPLSSSLLLASEYGSRQDFAGEWGLGADYIFGEGAGVLCLEERQHALRRGAPIYAEVLGTASSQQCALPLVAAPATCAAEERALWQAVGLPQPQAIEQNLRQCLASVPVQTSRGECAAPAVCGKTSGPWQYRSHFCCELPPHRMAEKWRQNQGWRNETAALASLEPELRAAWGLSELRRCNTKTLLGDCWSAAGAIELIAALLQAQDPQQGGQHILCYNFGLGGHHASALLQTGSGIE